MSSFRLPVVCVLLLALLMLDGCGFRMRGALGEYENIPPVYVEGSDPAAVDLRQFLRSAGSDVVDDPARAGMIVAIEDVLRSRRVQSVGSTGHVQEYELIYKIRFYVNDRAGNRLLDNQVITRSQIFSFDETEVNAKSYEEDFLFRDMQRDAVVQIMRMLAVLEVEPPPAPPAAEPS